MVAVISAMNRAYDIEESRPWWRVRLTAILLTVALSLFVIVAFALIVAGPQLADFAGKHLGLGRVWVGTWKIVQWPLALALVAVGIGLIYYFAPDAEQVWVWITPGSLAAICLWLLGSLGFRFYAANFGHYEAIYGALGGIIVLLLWFYMSGLCIVLGAEMNAEIEHASPWGKPPERRFLVKRSGLERRPHEPIALPLRSDLGEAVRQHPWYARHRSQSRRDGRPHCGNASLR